MTTSVLDTINALFIAQEISPNIAYGVHELAAEYVAKHSKPGVSPSEFQDYLFNEFGISDYLIATIILDGGIGNVEIEPELEGTKGENEFLDNLKSIDAIIWGKYQQYKTLALTAYLRLRQDS